MLVKRERKKGVIFVKTALLTRELGRQILNV